MTFWPVSMRVNSVKNDAADLIEPRNADDEAPAQEPLQVELPVESSDDETAGAPRQTQLF
jgi:hypothetical protein